MHDSFLTYNRLKISVDLNTSVITLSTASRVRWTKNNTMQLSVSVKWLAVKTASEMTYTVSGGALNSAQPQPTMQTKLQFYTK